MMFNLSELDHDEIKLCISWMTPFAQAVNATGFPQSRSSSGNGNTGSTSEDQSNYQCHSVDIKLLDLAHHQQEMIQESANLSCHQENDDPMIF